MTRATLPTARASAGERCCAPAPCPPMTAAEARRAAADLGILANPVRMRLLDLLITRDTHVCVCHLEEGVPVKQPTVSHHLRILRKAGLVSSERKGLYVYYRVNRAALDALRSRISDWLERLG
jgi:ArsR family transcriptional regulator